MKYQGVILKMESEYRQESGSQPHAVEYTLPIGEDGVAMNRLLGRQLEFRYLKKIYCIHCGALIKKSYAQGYCYPCFISLPETDACILRPELCRAHEGISRDLEWAKQNCLTDHYVYLAVTSGLKVGVTRESQIPTRWIDQGAEAALILARTPNRYLAGCIEVVLKEHFADKTNWRNMLTDNVDQTANLLTAKERAGRLLPDELKDYITDESRITTITYPVNSYPSKVKSISFDKTESFKATLTGIKGQYLLFDDDHVLNIRKHNGYLIDLEY
ncbi:MAG: DUF2797 domain-containing protein [Spirochaetales bacterium]|nr:DUF2797 domain-containing protein [Spirochaetales bacterium]